MEISFTPSGSRASSAAIIIAGGIPQFPASLPPFTPNKLLTRETWLAASMAYDPMTVEVLLSSAIDAVGANAPNRVLTTAMVGHLPITGSIQSR